MTLEQIQALTDHEIRVRVGTMQGWDCDPVEAREWGSRGQWAVKPGDTARKLTSLRMDLPNYPADLDACAEMEETLHGKAHPSALTELESKYRDRLATIMGCAWYQSAKLLRAKPRARCEAFLAVMQQETK